MDGELLGHGAALVSGRDDGNLSKRHCLFGQQGNAGGMNGVVIYNKNLHKKHFLLFGSTIEYHFWRRFTRAILFFPRWHGQSVLCLLNKPQEWRTMQIGRCKAFRVVRYGLF